MSIRLTAFTKRGYQLAERIANFLGDGAEVWMPERFHELTINCYQKLSEWTEKQFDEKNNLIFVSAAGIAVRSISPFLRDKLTDPAVLSIDEAGRFVIPLVSGHIGGANQLARKIARFLDAQAVISTATDVNGVFAVDEWAAEHGMTVENRQAAKRISAQLLAGQQVYAQCDFPHGDYPEGVLEGNPPDFAVTLQRKESFPEETLVLNPPVLVLGIGCKKNLPKEQLFQTVNYFFEEINISTSSIVALASIDLKQDDEGIRLLSDRMNIPCYFYSAEQLKEVSGEFSPSAFVCSVTGVDNVCERSAVLLSKGKLLIKKTKFSGITLAVAQREVTFSFEQRREKP